MYISALSIHDFRSYEELVLNFDKGVTCFIGANGQGKTNIVEAIGYLANLSSHRVGTDKNLIRIPRAEEKTAGRDVISSATLRARVAGVGTAKLLEVEIVSGKANRARINKSNVRPRDLLSQFSSVLFAPEDLSLIRDEPAVRRRFIDELAVKRRPALAGIIADYTQVMKQRAAFWRAAQKSGRYDLGQLEIWDEQLIVLAARIIEERYAVIAQLKPYLCSFYTELSGQKTADIHYQPAVNTVIDANLRLCEPSNMHDLNNIDGIEESTTKNPDEKLIAAALQAAAPRLREAEFRRGVNLLGAHRDEIGLLLREVPVKGYASHGETWSFALALRLASFELLRDTWDTPPVLILDDVFAELDETRRIALSQVTKKAEQVFITAAVKADIPSDFFDNAAHVFEVHSGKATVYGS